MSYPNLLEYHFLSSCPLVDSSASVLVFQPRFGYALPYLPYGKMFLVYFSLGQDLLLTDGHIFQYKDKYCYVKASNS
ncbi:hypothetical protein MAN88_15080 [Microcystis aeruginosa]|nr:hypothetical protein MAN88_15080 [Microcystis aeruginosa]